MPLSDRSDLLENQTIEPLLPLPLDQGSFFMASSIEQLAASQCVKPLRNVSELSGVLADDEVDDFVAGIYESRDKP
jgi:hypothetical protein